ncbi:unnamed protein product [Nesidiocoris tenuis]|uniref:Uncharacterized protein n=1 Tax=Nesidiocoris tenuis TaxID=355587 RepID=A0A6H5FVU9_9HEMI|nr:unnamed protein product [Nesidiocoris tenuis]
MERLAALAGGGRYRFARDGPPRRTVEGRRLGPARAVPPQPEGPIRRGEAAHHRTQHFGSGRRPLGREATSHRPVRQKNCRPSINKNLPRRTCLPLLLQLSTFCHLEDISHIYIFYESPRARRWSRIAISGGLSRHPLGALGRKEILPPFLPSFS